MGNSSGQSVVRRSPERADGKDESSTATSMQTVAPYADRWCPELPEPREIPVDQPPEGIHAVYIVISRPRPRVPLSSRFFVGFCL